MHLTSHASHPYCAMTRANWNTKTQLDTISLWNVVVIVAWSVRERKKDFFFVLLTLCTPVSRLFVSNLIKTAGAAALMEQLH